MTDSRKFGASVTSKGVNFTVWSLEADAIEVCLFEDELETDRLEMEKQGDGLHTLYVPELAEGACYGLRAHGVHDPKSGLFFDPCKLLLDPYATRIDRPFQHHKEFTARGLGGHDTASLMPKAIVEAEPRKIDPLPVGVRTERLIYELQVRAFTMRHPDVAEEDRGTLRALAHPSVLSHLRELNVGAVELMPITAWINERHLAALGLSNAWGYNPVSYFALDPRLAPNGLEDLQMAVEALHDADIAVYQDVVFNHNGESDANGTTLSFRGLDPHSYFSHDQRDNGVLINDTGCGNTLNAHSPAVRELVRESLRYFAQYGGIDGFRFDLAPIIGRGPNGFSANAPLIRDILDDPVLADRVMIAEPWDIGPGGYQLGQFPDRFLEWNDRYRDDVRKFWRGDSFASGAFATRITGSSDVFGDEKSRSVNFIAAHDGFTLYDMVSYVDRHNYANGEHNRDGHRENLSWNNGVEGDTHDVSVLGRRKRDVIALLSTLFLSRGSIMITAGDEFGRSQNGNNNAYAQDNETTWLDWDNLDYEILAQCRTLAQIRIKSGAFGDVGIFKPEELIWLRPDGEEKQAADWEKPNDDAFSVIRSDGRLVIYFNRSDVPVTFKVPGYDENTLPPRSVAFDHHWS